MKSITYSNSWNYVILSVVLCALMFPRSVYAQWECPSCPHQQGSCAAGDACEFTLAGVDFDTQIRPAVCGDDNSFIELQVMYRQCVYVKAFCTVDGTGGGSNHCVPNICVFSIEIAPGYKCNQILYNEEIGDYDETCCYN